MKKELFYIKKLGTAILQQLFFGNDSMGLCFKVNALYAPICASQSICVPCVKSQMECLCCHTENPI
jgi:hypothetical protein